MINEELNNLKNAIQLITGIENIFINSRTRDVADARCLFYKYAYDHLGIGFSKLGRHTNQHHATVMYSIKKFPNLYLFDKSFKNMWHKLLDEDILSKSLLSNLNKYKELDRILSTVQNNQDIMAELFREIEDIVLSKYSHIANTTND